MTIAPRAKAREFPVLKAVRELRQTVAADTEDASADGKITGEDSARIKAATLANV